MIILGIDPGSKITGWGIIEAGNGLRHLCHGQMKAPASLPLEKRVDAMCSQFGRILSEWKTVRHVVMEEPHFRGPKMLNALRALDAIKWTFRNITAFRGLEWSTYSAKEIKRAVASGSASKQTMIWSIAAIFEIPPPTEHEADALAAAICAANRCRIPAEMK